MEHPISSLSFKGPISEAIVEAKAQKKLFVIYLSDSGGNSETVQWEKSTWAESNVADALSKYCILMHILEGTADAAHLTAIYPQKSVPCLTVVGYNGLLLWQTEELVGAEILAPSLEKAWLGLQIQEATATFLTAALSSKESGTSSLGTHNPGSSDEGSSSGMDASQSSSCEHAQNLVNPEILEDNGNCESVIKQGVETSSKSLSSEQSLNPAAADLEESNGKNDNGSAVSETTSPLNAEEAVESVCNKIAKPGNTKTVVLNSSVCKSNDVHLNIRMPDGSTLKKKLFVTDTLRMVKNLVDEQQLSEFYSFDLAIPYPRKVFNDQDLRKSLSELGIFDRQALVVVPHRQGGRDDAGASSCGRTNCNTGGDSLRESNGGYFAFVKKVLSFMNPFSYLGYSSVSSGSSQGSQNSGWQHDPTSRVQGGHSETRESRGNSHNNRRDTPPRFGGIVHTLKLDEDDERFNDRNSFWNGNSTQYGGNDDGR